MLSRESEKALGRYWLRQPDRRLPEKDQDTFLPQRSPFIIPTSAWPALCILTPTLTFSPAMPVFVR